VPIHARPWRSPAAVSILFLVAYPKRIDEAGSYHHINSSGVFGSTVFRDDDDRATFLRLLEEELERSKWSCLSYTLMTTHYHLLIKLTEPSLSRGFQRLNGRFARAFNSRHGRRGALWQRRFHGACLESQSHLLEATRYIALNAPRANMRPKPEDWPWCSYGATVGLAARDPLIDEAAILGLFGRNLADGRENYRRFVEEGDPRVRRSQIRI
jgi:putative transposase